MSVGSSEAAVTGPEWSDLGGERETVFFRGSQSVEQKNQGRKAEEKSAPLELEVSSAQSPAWIRSEPTSPCSNSA